MIRKFQSRPHRQAQCKSGGYYIKYVNSLIFKMYALIFKLRMKKQQQKRKAVTAKKVAVPTLRRTARSKKVQRGAKDFAVRFEDVMRELARG